ncbi:MAG: glutamine-hydrolyzing carbamoyl-phosphate synthase small subunit [Candidatus Hydrothermarchaeota archaeon]
MEAVLALADGTVVRGKGFGVEKEVAAELVFNTSMTGYEEALTDPSYKGQVLLWTYPLCGNYGVRDVSFESDKIQVEGFAVREVCKHPSHHKNKKDLSTFLEEHDTPGIEGIDTRALTKKIREYGVMNCSLIVSSEKIDENYALELAKKHADISDINLLPKVGVKKPKRYDVGGDLHVVAVDCGIKLSILRSLLKRNVNVTLVPYFSKSREILELEPDGLLISNGPGDPIHAKEAIEVVRELKGKVPMMNICLGHQITGLAFGGRTYKLKYGHRGSNQPVKDLRNGKVYITSQNHGFAVDASSLKEGLRVSQINLNDNTVEGLVHEEYSIITAQYHPEANPGPLDTRFLFDEFVELMR